MVASNRVRQWSNSVTSERALLHCIATCTYVLSCNVIHVSDLKTLLKLMHLEYGKMVVSNRANCDFRMFIVTLFS